MEPSGTNLPEDVDTSIERGFWPFFGGERAGPVGFLEERAAIVSVGGVINCFESKKRKIPPFSE